MSSPSKEPSQGCLASLYPLTAGRGIPKTRLFSAHNLLILKMKTLGSVFATLSSCSDIHSFPYIKDFWTVVFLLIGKSRESM